MRLRALFTALGFVAFTVIALRFTPESRLSWIAFSGLCFLGIFVFDSYGQISKNGANMFLFLATYGLILKAILEPEAELFWRDAAGTVILIALSFEQNGKSWVGKGELKSSLGPAVLFFILTLASSLPVLDAKQSLSCTLLAILALCFLEVFYILRARAENHAGSFMSAMRSSASGIICLYYSSTFLPGISSEKPFHYFQWILPLLGLGLSLFGALFEEVRKRYILFCAGWSLLIFWAAMSVEPIKIFSAIGATIAGSWAIMMTNKRGPQPDDGREIFLKLSGWGIPGSIMFSFVIFTLMHSESVYAQRGSVIWLFSFFVYWAGLTNMKWEKSDIEKSPWSWRNSLALAITVAGGGLLAGAKIYPAMISILLGLKP